eukprot:m.138878 g.138878  ORF g.138878 m.138878 type:complete len:396 (-) comp24051_c1_seq1:87-1274(-)
MGWGVELWDKQGEIERHTAQGIEFVNQCRGFLGQVAQVELEYGKQMKKLIKTFVPPPENSTCNQAWVRILKSLEEIADQHENVSAALLGDVCNPMKQIVKTRAAERNDILTVVAKKQAELNHNLAGLDKVRKRYDKIEKDAENAQLAFEKAEKSDNVTKAKVEKARQTWAQKAKGHEEAQRGLVEETEKVNAFRAIYYHNDMPALFDRIQAVDENRATDLVNQFAVVGTVLQNCTQNGVKSAQAISAIVGQHNKAADSESFAKAVKSGRPLPEAIPVSVSEALKGPQPQQARQPQQQPQRQQPPIEQPMYYGSDEEEPEPEQPAPQQQATLPQCRMLYAFPGTNEGELSAQENELLALVENDGSGWVLVAKADGSRGYVPESYIEVIQAQYESVS